MSDTTRHLQYDLVRLGFSHHYLLNGILSLTALQLYSEDQSQSKWYTRAVAHQQAAITRAKTQFQSFDQVQHRALLGFSAFTSMYAVAEPLLRPARIRSLQTQFSTVKELLQALQLSRSTAMFVKQTFPASAVSESWLLNNCDINHQDVLQDLEIRFPQLATLWECIERQCDRRERAVCFHAVERLFCRIAFLLDNPGFLEPAQVIWGWGLEVHQTFLDLCLAQHEVALFILAHFPVLMSFYKDHWCMREWPGELLRQTREVLGDKWDDALKWPSDFIFGSVTFPKAATRSALAYDKA